MFIKIALLVVFFTVLIIVGIVSRKKADSVNSFVLGGRSIGPWMTAFAYGTTYFSAVIFVGYAGQFGFKYGLASTLDRPRQRPDRQPLGLGDPRTPHSGDE